MAVAYRSSGAFTEANATSTGSIGLPAGLADGDTLILPVQSRGTGATVTTPAGYTLAGPPIQQTASHRLHVFYKPVTNAAGEVAPSVTQSVSGAIRARLSAFSGGHATTPLDVALVTAKGRDTLTPQAPSATPITPGTMAVWILSTADDNALGSATQGTTAYTSDGTAGADGSLALVYELQGSVPAPVGTLTMTESANGPDNFCAATLLLRQAAVAASAPSTALFDDILFDVDIAFGYGPFAPDPQWTRVTDYLNGDVPVDVNVGRSDEDTVGAPGTASFALNNSKDSTAGRRFDPDYSAGPYYGQLVLNVPVRIWSRRDSVTHPIFQGVIKSWRQVAVGGSRDGYTAVSAVDITSLLTHPTPTSAMELRWRADDPEVYVPLEETTLGAIGDVSSNGWAGSYPARATIPDTIVRGRPGKKSKALTLVGATGFDGTLVNMTAATSPETIHTLEAWVKVTAFDSALLTVTGEVQPFRLFAWGLSSALEIAAVLNDPTQPYWQTAVADVTETFTNGPGAPMAIGTTYHVCVVLAETLDTLSLYVDGQLQATTDTTAFTFEGGGMAPGLWATLADESAATLAHVAAYQTALTAAEVLEHYEVGLIGGYGQTAAERLDLLAEYAGLDVAGLWDSSAMGTHTFLSEADYSGSVIEEMRKIVEADQGRLFVDGYGVLTAQSRIADIAPALTEHVVSQGDYGDDFTAEIRYDDYNREPASEALLRNIEIVNGTRLQDDDSIALYGPSDEQWTLPIAAPTALRAFAQSRLSRYASPQPRIDKLTVNLRGHLDAELDTAQNTTLALQLGYRISATARPASGLGDDIVEELRVEGKHDSITPHTWTRDLYLLPAGDAYNEGPYWTIGHATYGRIGTPAGNMIPG